MTSQQSQIGSAGIIIKPILQVKELTFIVANELAQGRTGCKQQIEGCSSSFPAPNALFVFHYALGGIFDMSFLSFVSTSVYKLCVNIKWVSGHALIVEGQEKKPQTSNDSYSHWRFGLY